MSLDRRELLVGGAIAPFLARPLSACLGAPSPLAGDLLAHGRKIADGSAQPLRLLIPQGSATNVLPVARAFEKGTGVPVVLEETPVDDVATTMTVRTLAGKSGFDVALPPTFAVPDLVEAKVVAPLCDLPSMALCDSDPRSLYTRGDMYRGRTYGFQTDGDVYLMFFNRRMLEDPESRDEYRARFGTELAIPPTWEELDRQMAFFHRPDQGRYGGTLFRTPTYIAWEYWIRLHAKGVYPFDERMTPRLNTPEGRAAAEELIAASSSQAPGVRSNGLFENWDAYKQGSSYANIGWGGSMKSFRAADSPIRESVVVAQTPGGLGSGGASFPVSYFNWGWNFTVSSQSKRKDLGATFSLFATEPVPSTEAVAAADGFFDPFLAEHYGDARVQDIYTKGFLGEHRAAMDTAIPDLYVEGRVEYFDLLGRFLDRANRGKSDLGKTMELLQRGWERITERIGRDRQAEQWNLVAKSYPAEVARHLR